MASYLRPRRGKRSTAISSDLVLKRGEVFFEVPDSGVGTGAGKIVMGDGSSLYGDLPYFSGIDLNGTDAIINFTDTITETDISNNNLYLANINPTNALKNIFTNLKQLVFNFGAEIGRFNNNLTANRLPFRFGYDPESQQYGYILPDGEGGADTVHPFSRKFDFNLFNAGTFVFARKDQTKGVTKLGNDARKLTITSPSDVIFVKTSGSSFLGCAFLTDDPNVTYTLSGLSLKKTNHKTPKGKDVIWCRSTTNIIPGSGVNYMQVTIDGANYSRQVSHGNSDTPPNSLLLMADEFFD